MESYREINRELILNNQELRGALAKSKHEICFLNSLLLEQREKYCQLKQQITTTLQKSYKSIISVLYPEEFAGNSSSIPIDVTVIENKEESEPRWSSNGFHIKDKSLINEQASCTTLDNKKTPVDGKLHQIEFLDKSPSTTLTNIHNESINPIKQVVSPTKTLKDNLPKRIIPDNPESDLDEYCLSNEQNSPSFNLHTICEEPDCTADGTSIDATVTDETLNKLLDAPCSTPKLDEPLKPSPTPQRKSLQKSATDRKLTLAGPLVFAQLSDDGFEQPDIASIPSSIYKSEESSVYSLHCDEQKHAAEILAETFSSVTKRERIFLRSLNTHNVLQQLASPGQRENSQTKSIQMNNSTLKDEKQRRTSKRSKKTLTEKVEKTPNASCLEKEYDSLNKWTLRPRRKVKCLKEPPLNTKLRK